MALRTLIVGTIAAAVVAGCGSSGSGSGSTPDVTGGPASNQATLFKATNLQRVLGQVKTHLKSGADLSAVKRAT